MNDVNTDVHQHSGHDHADGCAAAQLGPVDEPGYRRILWIALLANAGMFFVETLGGLSAKSTSLMADAIDFLGDTLSFAVSLFVLSMSLIWRARVALTKGLFMTIYGVVILALTVWNMQRGAVPEPATMSLIGIAAFVVNLGVALLLYRNRTGDANMRSVWLCSRNDALGNLAIIAAAAGVFGTGTAWPDIIVAVIMATLGLTAGLTIIRQARAEIKKAV